MRIDEAKWAIGDKHIDVRASHLPDRVSGEPPTQLRVVISVAVIVEAGLPIPILGTEPERIGIRLVAGFGDGVAVGVVFVVGDDGSVGIHQIGDVAVGVVGGEERTARRAVPTLDPTEQPTDAAGALQRSRQVEAPNIRTRRGRRGSNILADKIPAVVQEGVGLRGGGFHDPSAHVIVLVLYHGNPVGGNRNQPVFGVPGKLPTAIGGHITIGIVNGHDGSLIDVGVLVQFVGLVQVRDLVDAGQLAVPDGVVEVGIDVGAHDRICQFGPHVVPEQVGRQTRIHPLRPCVSCVSRNVPQSPSVRNTFCKWFPRLITW